MQFLCLYAGPSPGSSQLIALTSDPEVVREFARRITEGPEPEQPDRVLAEMERGRRRALEVVRDGGE